MAAAASAAGAGAATAAAAAPARESKAAGPVPGVTPDTICVAGAGLVGCMIALMLGRRGLPVRLIERRDDLRVKKDQKDEEGGRLANSAKRSINLALSHRGICALKHVQLLDVVKPWLVTMPGLYIHAVDGTVTFQPYGVGDQANYSVSRADLNALLLSECEKLPNITTSFEERLNSIDADATVHSTITRAGQPHTHFTTKYRLVIGADGVFSSVRSALMRLLRMDYSQQHINAVYKELTIPATAKGEYAMANSEGLHIWSRHEFMLIALPNPDKTFTGTLFAPADGPFGLNALTDKHKVMAFFQKHFPDAVPLMPNLTTEFFEAPTAPLMTVRCSPWYYSDKVVLMGDAAHAIVPFLGQGMNAGFEDALIFDELWGKCGGDVAAVLRTFGDTRKPSVDALADLSYANFKEMASHTASATFLAKKKFESVLYRISPSLWTPLYTMVSYTRTPYHDAVRRARAQDRALNLVLGGAFAAALGGAGYFLWKRAKL